MEWKKVAILFWPRFKWFLNGGAQNSYRFMKLTEQIQNNTWKSKAYKRERNVGYFLVWT